MNSHPKEPSKSTELPAEEGLDSKLRRDLYLIALAWLVVPSCICWASLRADRFESTLIPLLHGFLVGLYALLVFYQRQQKLDQALPLWRVSLVFCILAGAAALALVWLVRSAGWRNLSGLLILAMGLWSLILAGRRVRKSWSFSHQSVLSEIDSAKLDMVSIRGSHPIYPQLVYHYGGEYRGQLRTDRIQRRMAEIQKAIDEGRFRAIVRHLPDTPHLHRLESWWIEKA